MSTPLCLQIIRLPSVSLGLGPSTQCQRLKHTKWTVSVVGVRGLFRSLRQTTPSLNVRLNMLAPTFVRTPLVAPALSVLSAAGMVPSFVDMRSVVDATLRFAVDQSLHGRAWAVVSGKEDAGDLTVDLKDDEEGLWGSELVKQIVDGETGTTNKA